MRNSLLKASICLLLLLSNNNATNENFDYDDDSEYFDYDDVSEYDPNSTLGAYADSYCEAMNSKYAYRKALEEDTDFQHNVSANKVLYSLMKMHISEKWENRKTLDIAQSKFFAKTSGNLKKYKVQIEMIKNYLREANKKMKTFKADLKVLEKAAVIASNAYRKTSTYSRIVGKGTSTNDTLNDAEITEAYEKARSEFADGTEELKEKIKQLEMWRIEFLKFQTPENRINWLLAEMKEDNEQYY
uniref:Uncharacterized protein n=1 Tax=Trichobilharzia regenti TaxID=157069 RepID=A0AA85J302_TRIRE|nr:unnamed protein product [Trichobilharzia regenti]